MRAHLTSRIAYRLLLKVYPQAFRQRFSHDLQADFAQMLATRGPLYAWRRAVDDLFRAVPLTTRARDARIRGPIAAPGESAMGSLLFDVRHSVRGLIKAPTFTLVTVLTLALGIGANSAIFTLVNAVLLRPLGYAEPDRLMLVHEGIPESGVARFEVSPADYFDLAAYQRSFAAIGAYRTRSRELSGSGEPEQIPVTELTSSVFPILGVRPARGRVFLPEEDQQNTGVAVISDGFWKRRFGGAEVIGRRILLDRNPVTIVGVMPPTFEFPKRGALSNAEPADVWLPLVFTAFEREARGMMYNHSVIARLRDGVSPAQAALDTAALSQRILENYPPVLRNAIGLKINTTMLVDEIAGQVRRPLLVLLGAVGLVLLVACANVANLVLSRSVTRQREIGIRAALGAGRLRLFQILLLEGLLLAACGGSLGLAFGYWALRAVPAVLVTSLPGLGGVPIDWRVAAFTTVLSLGCAVAFALVPLGAGLRRDLHDVLREGSARTIGGSRQHRVQSVLVVASVAFAFVLLVGAGLLVRSFQNLIATESGVRAGNVLTMKVQLPPNAYADAGRIRNFYHTLEERLRTLPGVRSAAISTDLPLEPDGERRVFTPENSPVRGVPTTAAVTWVHGAYFQTYGVPIVRGRSFSEDEQREDRRAAIVSQRLAQTYWPGEDPIGKRLKWGLPASLARWHMVVGVAGDVQDGPPGSEPVIHVYVPYSELSDDTLTNPTVNLARGMNIAVSGESDPGALVAAARSIIASLDPAMAVSRVQTFEQLERDRSAPQRFSAVVLTGFAAGALLLAAIGLYGVLAFVVMQRRREIGVRLALGAPRAQVVRSVVKQGMTLVALGLAAGGLAAVASTRLMNALLFGTKPFDPLTFSVVPLLLAATALAACYLPARRAASVDPTTALRAD